MGPEVPPVPGTRNIGHTSSLSIYHENLPYHLLMDKQCQCAGFFASTSFLDSDRLIDGTID